MRTLYGLLTQTAQLACLRNTTSRLAPDGVFVVEGFVFDAARFQANQRVQVNRVEGGGGPYSGSGSHISIYERADR